MQQRRRSAVCVPLLMLALTRCSGTSKTGLRLAADVGRRGEARMRISMRSLMARCAAAAAAAGEQGMTSAPGSGGEHIAEATFAAGPSSKQGWTMLPSDAGGCVLLAAPTCRSHHLTAAQPQLQVMLACTALLAAAAPAAVQLPAPSSSCAAAAADPELLSCAPWLRIAPLARRLAHGASRSRGPHPRARLVAAAACCSGLLGEQRQQLGNLAARTAAGGAPRHPRGQLLLLLC